MRSWFNKGYEYAYYHEEIEGDPDNGPYWHHKNWFELPHYGTRSEDALRVLEHMQQQGLPIDLRWGQVVATPPAPEPPSVRSSTVVSEWRWGVNFSTGQADALTLPRAICLAALNAVGAEVPA